MVEPIWERMAVSVAATVTAAAIVGIYVSISRLGDSLDLLASAQAVTQSQLTDVRAALHDSYTAEDAKRDFAAVWATDKDQYARIQDHEQRIRALESKEHL